MIGYGTCEVAEDYIHDSNLHDLETIAFSLCYCRTATWDKVVYGFTRYKSFQSKYGHASELVFLQRIATHFSLKSPWIQHKGITPRWHNFGRHHSLEVHEHVTIAPWREITAYICTWKSCTWLASLEFVYFNIHLVWMWHYFWCQAPSAVQIQIWQNSE